MGASPRAATPHRRRQALVAGEASHRDRPHAGRSARARRVHVAKAARGHAYPTDHGPVYACEGDASLWAADSEFRTDEELEAFLEQDLSDYITPENFKPARFEFLPKTRQVNLRFSEALLDAVRQRAREGDLLSALHPAGGRAGARRPTLRRATRERRLPNALRNCSRSGRDGVNIEPRKSGPARASVTDYCGVSGYPPFALRAGNGMPRLFKCATNFSSWCKAMPSQLLSRQVRQTRNS